MALLALGAVTWAALPISSAGAGARPALIVGTVCAAASLAQLAVALAAERSGGRPRLADVVAGLRSPHGYLSPGAHVWLRLWLVINSGPWAQGLTLAVLTLEALHRPRPWHTVVLGVVLLGYLLTLHLAESTARPAALRPQLPLIIGGVCLAGLSAGAAMLPATSSGAGWLSVLAAIAAVMVAGLALPV